MSGQARRAAGGPGSQITERYSMIVPPYAPVHQGFAAESVTLTRSWAAAGRSSLPALPVQDVLV